MNHQGENTLGTRPHVVAKRDASRSSRFPANIREPADDLPTWGRAPYVLLGDAPFGLNKNNVSVPIYRHPSWGVSWARHPPPDQYSCPPLVISPPPGQELQDQRCHLSSRGWRPWRCSLAAQQAQQAGRSRLWIRQLLDLHVRGTPPPTRSNLLASARLKSYTPLH